MIRLPPFKKNPISKFPNRHLILFYLASCPWIRLSPLAFNNSFIARAYAYHVNQTKELIKEAIKHRGASLVQVLQPCPTYNNIMTQKWYEERIYYISERFPDYDPTVRTPEERARKITEVIQRIYGEGDKIALGVILRDLSKDSMEERLDKIVPGYLKTPPALRATDLDGKPIVDVVKVFKDRVVET